MGGLDKSLAELKAKVDQAFDTLGILRKEQELEGYQKQMEQPDFWSDQDIAREVSVKHAKLKDQIEPWLKLAKDLQDLKELNDMADSKMAKELQASYASLAKKYDELEFDLKFSNEYDDKDAILTIQAGAGGTDAQDWTQMLQRMYLRWTESHKSMKAELLHETAGEEAGLKNTTLMISGPYAYGKLRSEHGVHRLVRLSPFNTAGTRETSFAMVEVIPKLDDLNEVEIDDKDVRVDTFRASGHGGQSVNTTDSAVRVTHEPTGITVSIQNEKSQIKNRQTAMGILRSRLARLKQEQRAEKIADLKGPNVEAAWGNQIRNYVLHPYQMVKDTRTEHQTSDVEGVLDGGIDEFIESYLVSGQETK